MGHETVLGAFLVQMICPALWGGYWYSAFLMAVAILATGSSMSIGALGVVAVLFVWHRFGFRAAAALSVLGLGSLLAVFIQAPGNPFLSDHGRAFIWQFGYRAWKEHRIFGGGIGSWVGHYLPIYKAEILAKFSYHLPAQLHCDYLDFLVEYGVGPFLVLGASFLQLLRKLKPTWPQAVVLGTMVNAVGNFPLCLPNTALVFLISYAYAMRDDKME